MGRAFFPLDCLLRLRQDRWSDGAARVALRLALSASSFRCAAENFSEAVGVATSGARLWRLTQDCGQRLAEQKEAEAAAAFAPAEPGEGADQERLPRVDSLAGQTANLSTDGGMLHIRDEGWKEVKLSTISAVVQEEQRPMRWTGDGARAVAKLRARLKSGCWDETAKLIPPPSHSYHRAAA